MDKYEYKLRSDEILNLIEREKYEEAADIADTIDWRRVKSINMLLRVASLYRVNHRNEDSRAILMLAYDRYPTNRTVLYCLCEVSVELDDVVAAIEYYKEFVKQAPRDNGVFTLRYKILEAQEASLEERIELLEELKKRDYQEEWAYELAYLYHRVGLGTKCVEECDDLILWFGDGPFVKKAMELKMLHSQLTSIQEKKYALMKDSKDGFTVANEKEETQDESIEADIETDIEANIEENQEISLEDSGYLSEEVSENTYYPEELTPEENNLYPEYETSIPVVQEAPKTKTITDLSQYNTINLQKVVAESMRELFPDDEDIYAANKAEVEDLEYASKKMAAEREKIAQEFGLEENNNEEKSEEIIREENIIFETAELEEITNEEALTEETLTEETLIEETKEAQVLSEEVIEQTQAEEIISEEVTTQEAKEETLFTGKVAQMISDICEIKPEENSGAIKTVFVPEQKFEPVKPDEKDFMIKDPAITGESIYAEEEVEEEHVPFRPMTGQMNIEDVLKEWERLKEENEQKRKENVRELVLQQTGQILANFDEAIKNMEDLSDEDDIEDIQGIRDEEINDEASEIEEFSEIEEISEIENSESEIEELAEIKELPEIEDISEELAEAIENTDEINEIENVEETDEVEEIEEIDEVQEETNEATENVVEEQAVEEIQSETVDVTMNTREIESLPEKILEATKQETKAAKQPEPRNFTPEEKALFENFAVNKKVKKQIITVLDNMSLASYSGNIIISGEVGLGTISVAKNILKVFKSIEPDFTGKTAKITGSELNLKNVSEVFDKLQNGALIIDEANGMSEKTIFDLSRLLNQEDFGIVIFVVDTKTNIQKLFAKQAMMADYFNLRVDLAQMDNNALVNYAKNYALQLEYSIDDLGTLALHTRIERIQGGNHIVTKDEVREIIDEAIWKSKKSKLKNFVDVLLAKRYDDQDMIVLRERDFM